MITFSIVLRINKHEFTSMNYVALNDCCSTPLLSNSIVFREPLERLEKLITAASKIRDDHTRNAVSVVLLSPCRRSQRANVPRNVRKRNLSEPRRAKSLFPWHTWTSIVFARETLHFQPILGISHSHGAKHCFVKNFPPACLFFSFLPLSLPASRYSTTRTQSREYRTSTKKEEKNVKRKKRDESGGKRVVYRTRPEVSTLNAWYFSCARRVSRALDQACFGPAAFFGPSPLVLSSGEAVLFFPPTSISSFLLVLVWPMLL